MNKIQSSAIALMSVDSVLSSEVEVLHSCFQFFSSATMAGRAGTFSLSGSLDSQIEGLDGESLITSLQSQLKSLQDRVKELEIENARLSSQISNCRCYKIEGNSDCSVVSRGNSVEESAKLQAGSDVEGPISIQGGSSDERSENAGHMEATKSINGTKKKSREKTEGCNMKTLHHCAKRYVALKIMYFGQRFYGFASEAQMDPTVESEIFKALKQTKLLVGDKEDLQYSRCGRTDKGVSSVGQVISLFLRSNLKNIGMHVNNEENAPSDICEEEIDYVRVLNRVLPKDIRVIGWCPAPTDFHARFSCISREYKYHFWRGNLDLSAMEMAGKKFIGEHDFRNFCKMDAVNVHNYRRRVTSFDISTCNERSESDQIWEIIIKGSAFLWHQVRCMVAVLFMVGQGLESPNVIDILLDTTMTPRKPQYAMAPELPLVFHSCEFEGLNFICSPDAMKALREHLKNEYQTYRLKAAIFHEALLICLSATNVSDGSPLNYTKKKKAVHVPLTSRPTEPSYEERRAKLKLRE
ncbi:PREDICTED: tRNA pseudouridine(38/39) synthase isoform X2 [Nelumbo nucifera]|uniref:tRNA pseudouridine(38/39) synthase isoform X2 n=2 Tax=Nelumbo nucifera TaxID=4432 RepID=A0A1U8A7P1_NELNU|nr:PREDICTED: tRNA pseudouridine(38/39) synthase isoform X2 [Nelumbo nucifera]